MQREKTDSITHLVKIVAREEIEKYMEEHTKDQIPNKRHANDLWNKFEDEQLNALEEEALSGNFTIRLAWDRLSQAEQIAVQAGAALLPGADYQAEVATLNGVNLPLAFYCIDRTTLSRDDSDDADRLVGSSVHGPRQSIARAPGQSRPASDARCLSALE